MLKASVETSRSSASLKACGFGSDRQMTPMTSRPDVIGTPSQDSVGCRPLREDGARRERLRQGVQAQRTLGGDDDRGQAVADLVRLDLEPLAVVEPVREADPIRGPIDERDEHVAGLPGEDLAQPLADQLDDGRELELRGEAPSRSR